MTPELLAKVTGLELALVEARAGETLSALAARSGNTWSAAETSAWNGLAPGAALRGGQLVKIARVVAWQPREKR
jgi:predicted Zn-dependent protease